MQRYTFSESFQSVQPGHRWEEKPHQVQRQKPKLTSRDPQNQLQILPGPTWAAYAADDLSCFPLPISPNLRLTAPPALSSPGPSVYIVPLLNSSCSPIRPSLNTNPSPPRCTLLLSLLTFCVSFSSVQFSSVTQSCLTLWDPMDRSTPGLPVHHQLPESTQTHVH